MRKTISPKQREILIILISVIFVMLFVFVSVDKWKHFSTFQKNMHNQPINGSLASFLVNTLPATEFITAILFFFSRTRRFALWLSTILMAVFTGYVALVIANQLEYIPCSCAGILQNLSWKSHLLLNIGLLLAGILGLVLYYRKPASDNSMNIQMT